MRHPYRLPQTLRPDELLHRDCQIFLAIPILHWKWDFNPLENTTARRVFNAVI